MRRMEDSPFRSTQDDVLFHESNHTPRPDIQYGGSLRIDE
jgi:hypothetical protein